MRQITNPTQFRENIRLKFQSIIGDEEVAINLENATSS